MNLKPAHTDKLDGILWQFKVLWRQAMLDELLWDEVPHGDVQLLLVRVTGNLNDLHPVEKGGWNRRQAICCRYEQNLGQVKGHVQIAENSSQGGQCVRR